MGMNRLDTLRTDPDLHDRENRAWYSLITHDDALHLLAVAEAAHDYIEAEYDGERPSDAVFDRESRRLYDALAPLLTGKG